MFKILVPLCYPNQPSLLGTCFLADPKTALYQRPTVNTDDLEIRLRDQCVGEGRKDTRARDSGDSEEIISFKITRPVTHTSSETAQHTQCSRKVGNTKL